MKSRRWIEAVGVAILLVLTGCVRETTTHAASGSTGSTSSAPTTAGSDAVLVGGSTTSPPGGTPSSVASATTSLHSTAPVPTPAALTPAVTVAPPIGGTTVPVPPTLAPAAVPTLRILAPKPGDVIAAPWAIQYAVSDFAAGPSQGSIRLTLGDGGAFALNLSLSGPSGVVYLSDLRVSGLRTLVFTLMNASQQPLGNPEATVTVPNVTLTGLR